MNENQKKEYYLSVIEKVNNENHGIYNEILERMKKGFITTDDWICITEEICRFEDNKNQIDANQFSEQEETMKKKDMKEIVVNTLKAMRLNHPQLKELIDKELLRLAEE